MHVQAFGIIPVHQEGAARRFLLVQHCKGHTFREGAGDGHWAFPKGHADENEQGIATAVRELQEETGIGGVDVIDSVLFHEEYTFIQNNERVFKRVTYFIGFVQDTEVIIQQNEIQDYRWVSYEEAIDLMTFEEGRDVLRRAQKYLVNNNS